MQYIYIRLNTKSRFTRDDQTRVMHGIWTWVHGIWTWVRQLFAGEASLASCSLSAWHQCNVFFPMLITPANPLWYPHCLSFIAICYYQLKVDYNYGIHIFVCAGLFHPGFWCCAGQLQPGFWCLVDIFWSCRENVVWSWSWLVFVLNHGGESWGC